MCVFHSVFFQTITPCWSTSAHYVRVWVCFCLLFLTQLLSTRHGFALSLMELTHTGTMSSTEDSLCYYFPSTVLI